MTTPQEMLELADELDTWPATGGRGDALDAGFVSRLMKRAAVALRQAAAPQGREAKADQLPKFDYCCHGIERKDCEQCSRALTPAVAPGSEHRKWTQECCTPITPAVAPDAGARESLFSEQERHAVGHARYQVARATPDNPECCFDYELVGTLIDVVDRLTDPPPQVDSGREEIARKLKQFTDRHCEREIAMHDLKEALTLSESALEQAQDCIRGETPEDMSREDADADTISKIREALHVTAVALRPER